MSRNSDPVQPGPAASGWLVALALGSIVALTALAYSRTFSGPPIFDDFGSVLENPTIRRLATAFKPLPSGWPVSGRPILNFSFAVNYLISGEAFPGYHALNLAIHILGSLALFGIVRRTLRLVGFTPKETVGLAWGSALLWAVHPIQTESVSYISQRAESLMGLWYLLAVYSFIRAFTGSGKRTQWVWGVLSVLAAALGMGTKEVTATLPLVIFIYDRIFLAKSWGGAWRERKGYYIALATTWIPLGLLIAGTGGRGGTAGFHAGLSWWAYAVTQIRGIGLYLRLSVWPEPLRFTYGLILGGPILQMIVYGIVVFTLIGYSLVKANRGSAWAFLGIWFFGILAPSSSIIPVSTELIAEHRVYLSLAAVTTLFVVGVYLLLKRRSSRSAVWVGVISVTLVATAAARATFLRNRVYSSVVAMWADAASKAPNDPGVRNNYGIALCEAGKDAESIEQFQIAIAIVPGYWSPHYNLGNALMKLGRVEESVPEYRAALAGGRQNAAIHYELGEALQRTGRPTEAMEQFEAALTAETFSSVIWYELGNAFMDAGRNGEALTAFEKALTIRPDYPDALLNHAGLLVQSGQLPKAIDEFQQVLRLQPNAPDVHNDLGSLLAQSGRLAEAKSEFEAALALKPDYTQAQSNLERVKEMIGRGLGH